jgi:hypothetical protein
MLGSLKKEPGCDASGAVRIYLKRGKDGSE